jgi:aminobenzoyl-glutamate utilization protein B
MAKTGVFDDLDAAIDWHPSDRTSVRNNAGLAMNNFEVEFFGRSAHGAVNPWDGRSALDAVELMNYGVNLMREHVGPTTRIHYVIPAGGEAPNVVPNYARVWYYARDVNRRSVERLYERVLKIAQGAAIATETTHKVTLLTGVHEYLLLRSLQERLQQHLQAVGAPEFTLKQQQFGRTLQRSLRIPEEGFDTTIVPLAPKPEAPFGGSTDVAEVSWITPTVGFRMATTAKNVPWHSWAVTACHGSDAGIQGAIAASKLIAVMGVDLMTDAELMTKAKSEFAAKTAGQPYHSPIPMDQPVPMPRGPEKP